MREQPLDLLRTDNSYSIICLVHSKRSGFFLRTCLLLGFPSSYVIILARI